MALRKAKLTLDDGRKTAVSHHPIRQSRNPTALLHIQGTVSQATRLATPLKSSTSGEKSVAAIRSDKVIDGISDEIQMGSFLYSTMADAKTGIIVRSEYRGIMSQPIIAIARKLASSSTHWFR